VVHKIRGREDEDAESAIHKATHWDPATKETGMVCIIINKGALGSFVRFNNQFEVSVGPVILFSFFPSPFLSA
jgi:hypothetical protein